MTSLLPLESARDVSMVGGKALHLGMMQNRGETKLKANEKWGPTESSI